MSYLAASSRASSGPSPVLVAFIVILLIVGAVLFIRYTGERKRSRRVHQCDQRKGFFGRCKKDRLHPGDHDNGSTTWPRIGHDLRLYQGTIAELMRMEEEQRQRQELVDRYEGRQRRLPPSTFPANPPAPAAASPRLPADHSAAPEPVSSRPVNNASPQQATSYNAAASHPAPPGSGSGGKGSEMINAWLDELTGIQPQYGRLLQATVDEAGPLPAISEDGIIYTVSHERFWQAVGFSTAFAGVAAENRNTQAVLAMAEAQKAQDAATMAQKGDEAKFWTDVRNWIESVGVAKARPAVLPKWLEEFQPTFMQ